MHIDARGTLVKVATKRAKYDKDGQEVEGAALSLTVDLPIADLAGVDIVGILRAVEKRLEVQLDDGQTSFDVVGDRLEVAVGAGR